MTNRNRYCRKPDPVVLAFCALTLISCLGAIGRQGRQRAKEMVCLSNLGRWGACFQSYTEDHDGKFNPGWDVGETELWMNALRSYYQDRWSLLFCPTATRPAGPDTGWDTFTTWSRNVSLPTGGEHRYVSSYGINSWTNRMTQSRGTRREEWFWGTTQDVQQPECVPVFADATWHDAWPQATDTPPGFPPGQGWDAGGIRHEMDHFCIDRHEGAVNLLLMDFSARKVGLKELWTLRWHRSFDTEGPWTQAGGVQPADWPEWMRNFKDY